MEGGPEGKLKAGSGVTTSQPSSAILPLPPEVIAQIKSSAAITSLNSVIIRLVENSLDAGADRLQVDVDYTRGNCTVEDNGLGIPPSEFAEPGGLGKLYHTSKYARSDQLYGQIGTFIASLASLCLLTVTSKHRLHYSTNSILIHHSKIVSRLKPAPTTHGLSHNGHGTRVSVRDIFGSMPVRVKQRATLIENQLELEKLWEDLKSRLTALLLAYSLPVSLRVTAGGTSNAKSLILNGQKTKQQSSIERTNALSSKYALWLSLLGQSGNITPGSNASWIPASASSKTLSVKGILSLEPVAAKNVQYVAIGKRPLARASHNELYDHINRVFGRSRFGAIEEEALSETEKRRREQDRRFKKDGLTRRQTLIEKGVDRWPMFVLKIQFKEQNPGYDELARSESVMSSIIQVLDALVVGWLDAHHFRPQKSPHKRQNLPRPASTGGEPANQAEGNDGETSRVPSRASLRSGGLVRSQLSPVKGISQSPGNMPSRAELATAEISKIKSSHHRGPNDMSVGSHRPSSAPPLIVIEALTPARLVSPTKRLKTGVSSALDSGRTTGEQNGPKGAVAEDEVIDWVDPVTKQVHKLNSRTGTLIPLYRSTTADTSRPSSRLPSLANRRKTTEQGRSPSPTKSASPWLDSVLGGWNNPVFRSREQPISRATFELPLADGSRFAENVATTKEMQQAFGEVSRFNSSKISKKALKDSTIIAQADEKFIIVLVEGEKSEPGESAPKLLVAIDQHAADERIKVEELLGMLCSKPDGGADDVPVSSRQGHRAGIQTQMFNKALRFAIPLQEAAMFQRHASYFARWSIVYEVEPASQSTVLVISAPPVIAERCKNEPKVLISLLRQEIWSREEKDFTTSNQGPVAPPSTHDNEKANPNSWIKDISGCPSGLLDMVNSRACRSAIMFNDRLEHKQCEHLVNRLANCALPFQCAHGRPSMVPLVDLGSFDAGNGLGVGWREELEEEDFATAYTRWRADED